MSAEMIQAIVSAAPVAADETVKSVRLGTKALSLRCSPRGGRAPRSRTSSAISTRSIDGTACSVPRLVVAVNCVHDLPDAKKQYLHQAAADRMTPHGALLIADHILDRNDTYDLHNVLFMGHTPFGPGYRAAGLALVDEARQLRGDAPALTSVTSDFVSISRALHDAYAHHVVGF